jgi:Fur family peroxide stress response transcriptional regulator
MTLQVISPSTPHDTLTRKLTAEGMRFTRQREVVYKALLNKRDHPTADEVYARVRSNVDGISLATVYNTLETLVQCNLVKQVNFDREPTRYCPNLKEHAHFHDAQTGQIFDVVLDDGLLEKVRQNLPYGFEAAQIEINIRGRTAYKPNCIRN